MSNKCTRYNSVTSNTYEGIPQNLAINIIAYIGLVIVFVILRKKWKSENFAWLNKPIDILEVAPLGPVEENILQTSVTGDNSLSEISSVGKTKKLFQMIPLFIKMRDAELQKRCGGDAVTYCKFQRRLIAIGAVMTVSCLLIIVPLNLYGQSQDSSLFKTLTIANIGAKSPLVIGHVIVALSLMLFVFFIAFKFLKTIDIQNKEKPNCTIMITNIPPEYCNSLLIEQHIREAYPSVKIVQIQQAYEIEKLFDLYTKKIGAEEALLFCYNELENTKQRVMVAKLPGGRICMLCKSCQGAHCAPLDGIQYYEEEVTRWTQYFTEEKSKALSSKKIPIWFITLENIHQALQIRREYICQYYCCFNQAPKSQSTLSLKIKSNLWKVIFSPMPDDILWQNLHKRGWRLWIPLILVNIFISVFVIFLSTPPMVLQILSRYNITILWDNFNNPWVSQFAPALILVMVTSLMPFLVCWANDISGHWTKTKYNISIMYKLFAVLVTTVLILPSLGLTSVDTLINLFILNETERKTRLECIFLSDGGALFCNYIITAAFIGVGVEMLRIGELLMFGIKFCISRSRAEDSTIGKSLLWNFPFGINYAWTLTLFSIMSAYSVIVPLVTPFGLIYLILKHLNDRYNMIYVDVPTTIDNEVHVHAVKLMQVCLIFTQASVTLYVNLRQEPLSIISICCYMMFWFGVIITVGQNLKRIVTKMAWIKYSEIKNNEGTHILTPEKESSGEVEYDSFAPSRIKLGANDALLQKIRKSSTVSHQSEEVGTSRHLRSDNNQF